MRSWQDIVLAVSIFGFNLALIPSVWRRKPPAFTTGLMTTLLGCATTVVYASLSLWFSALMAFINALLWAILAGQRLIADRRTR